MIDCVPLRSLVKRSLARSAQQFYTLRYRGPAPGWLITWMVKRGNQEEWSCICSVEELRSLLSPRGPHLLAPGADSAVDPSAFCHRPIGHLLLVWDTAVSSRTWGDTFALQLAHPLCMLPHLTLRLPTVNQTCKFLHICVS